MELRKETIKINGGEIPIILFRELDEEGEFFVIEIDGVEWLTTENQMHAVVLLEMMKDHITDYMQYQKI